MTVKEKLYLTREQLQAHGPINIVILGDSVSHGAMNGYIDYESVYWNRLRKRLNAVRDYVPVNMICAAIGGTTAADALPRLHTQVLCHAPDLVVVCYGLNDVNGALSEFTDALAQIFDACLCHGCEVIYMTPNMLNTNVAPDTPREYLDYAKKTAELQNGGRMDTFMRAACEIAKQKGVAVCDCYADWKALSLTEDVTARLINRINHPAPDMHALFADRLFALIMGKDIPENNGTFTDDCMTKSK